MSKPVVPFTFWKHEPQASCPACAGGYCGVHYSEIWDMNSANNAAEEGLFALRHQLPLDPSVRYSMMKEIEQVRGRQIAVEAGDIDAHGRRFAEVLRWLAGGGRGPGAWALLRFRATLGSYLVLKRCFSHVS